MKLFSINEVEKYCRIKAATLRIWEKRYALCKPERKNGGNRKYSLSELELLLNISLLNRNGFKISRLVTMSSEMLSEKTAALLHVEDKLQYAINRLIVYKFSTDIDAFEKHLNYCFTFFGIDSTLTNIIVPFLEKVNMLSYYSTSNEVHLAVTIIRKKIIYYTENLSPAKALNKTALLFLPEGEHYDLMLLYMCYIVKLAGLKPIYLGTNISEQNIMIMLKQKKPDYLYTYITPKNSFKMFSVVSYLLETSPQQKINVISNGYSYKEDRDNIQYTHYNHFSDLLLTAHA